MKFKMNSGTIILICIILFVLLSHIFYSCGKTNNSYLLMEGFTSSGGKSTGSKNTASSKKNNITKKEGFSNSGGNNSMLMFANTKFKPECCPTTYTNSSGCACMSNKQYEYLIQRGGNNVPYSEY